MAKIEDMKDYQYIRDDMTEDLLDRLSVCFSLFLFLFSLFYSIFNDSSD